MTPRERDSGDDLLAQLGWVRRLAVAIARDQDLADDLVQQATGEWLTSRPEWARRGEGLRRWFARVVQRRSADHHRSESARQRRERAVSPPMAIGEATVDIVVRLDLHQRVAAAVRELAEPYRSTILHRFLDERSTGEVAVLTGVPEATVRKRVERGLALLRDRLASERRDGPRAWALLLLDPALRGAVTAHAPAASMFALLIGDLMSKKLALVATAALTVGLGMFAWSSLQDDDAAVEVGGRGVVVSAAAAGTHESRVAAPGEKGPERSPADAAREAAATDAARLAGHVFVDGARRAPSDLAIEVRRGTNVIVGAAKCNVTDASWTFTSDERGSLTLWVTSSETVPGQIPVPAAAFEGAFDLLLRSGRTLALTFLDRVTRAPLTALWFEVDKAIELERGGGRALYRSHSSRHRTDADGRCVLTGVPEVGVLNAIVDLQPREQRIAMRGGGVLTAQGRGRPVWSLRVDAASPPRIEATIFTAAILGAAFANGMLPPWARGDGDRTARVRTRELGFDHGTDGDVCDLDCDDSGAFVLRANAPSRHAVWLEGPDRQRLSTETMVAFDQPGAQAPITFTPLEQRRVLLHCLHAPGGGALTVRTVGDVGIGAKQSRATTGGDLEFVLQLGTGDHVELQLRAAGSAGRRENGWRRSMPAASSGGDDVSVDLRGTFRSVAIAGDLPGASACIAVGLVAVAGDSANADEMAIVPLRAGRGEEPVFLPAGRWFYRCVGAGPQVLAGVITVRDGDTEVELRPTLQQVPADGVSATALLDVVDGVSLRACPQPLRALPAAEAGTTVAMPATSTWSAGERR